MRLLVGLRDDADAADDTLVVELTRGPIRACPLLGRPACDARLVGKRNRVELAFVGEAVLGPGLLDDREDLLEDRPVVQVDLRAIHRCRRHPVLLSEDVGPAVLVAAGEPGDDAALAEMVEDRELLGAADRVPSRDHEPERRELDPLGPRRQIGVEHERRDRGLEPF